MLYSYFIIALRNIKKGKLYATFNIMGLSLSLAAVLIIGLYVHTELSADRHLSKTGEIYRVSYRQVLPTEMRTAVSSFPMGPALKRDYPAIKDFVRINFPAQYFGDIMIRYENQARHESGIMFADDNFFEFFNYEFLYGDPLKALAEPNSIVLTKESAQFFFGDQNPVGKTLRVEESYSLMVTAVVKLPQQATHLRFNGIIPVRGMDNYLERLYGNFESFTSNNSHTYVLVEESFDPVSFEEKNILEFARKYYELDQTSTILTLPHRLEFVPLHDIYFDNKVFAEVPNPHLTSHKGNKTYLYVFSLFAIFLLVVAAINYTNMAIARSVKRSRETGVRKVLGAAKTQVLGQHLGEAGIFVVVSLLLALLFTELSLPLFNQIMAKDLSLAAFDLFTIVAFVFVLVLVLTFLAGSYPALYLSTIQPITALKGQFKLKGKTLNLKNILFTFQFVVSVFMIIVTLLIYQQFGYMQSKDMGFVPHNRVSFGLPRSAQISEEGLQSFKSRLTQHNDIERVSAALSNPLPGNSIETWGLRAETDDGPQAVTIRIAAVDENFLDVFEIPLVEGRNFDNKSPADFQGAVLVNEKARQELGWKDPIGKSLSRPNQTFNVVGVVSDFHYFSLHQPIEPLMLIAFRGGNIITAAFAEQVTHEGIAHLQKIFDEHFPGYPFEYRFVDQQLKHTLQEEASTARLMGVLTVFSLFISLVGLFGLSAFTLEQKTREIAIRRTYGANTSHVFTFLSKGFVPLLTTGFLIAIPVAYVYINHWLSDFAYRIELTPWPFMAGMIITGGIALLTLGWHAVKSSGANPVDALNSE